ncbi:hypothetical protein, partial [Staphylococcus aureus]|uniref:hypothetical protein n=1 Tax=Staphylococcus aureus TaxID=1280 RepID=UPI00190BE409
MLKENSYLNEKLSAKDFVDIVIEVKNFFNEEYDTQETVSEIFNEIGNDLRIPIAFTELEGHEYFDIQTYLDLELLRVIKEVRGSYENLTLAHYEFENLEDKDQAINYIRNTD